MENPQKSLNNPIIKGELQTRDFTKFKKGLEDIAAESLNTYNNYGRKKFGNKERKTSEEIEALIYPSDDLYKTLGVERNNEFVQDEVYDSIKKIVSKVNKNFQAYSQISKITLLKEPLEMTTSQKVKRNFVAKIYELSHS